MILQYLNIYFYKYKKNCVIKDLIRIASGTYMKENYVSISTFSFSLTLYRYQYSLITNFDIYKT